MVVPTLHAANKTTTTDSRRFQHMLTTTSFLDGLLRNEKDAPAISYKEIYETPEQAHFSKTYLLYICNYFFEKKKLSR